MPELRMPTGGNNDMVTGESTFDMVDDVTAEILRGKSEAERLAIAHGLWRSANRMIRSVLRSEHPDWSDARIQLETARRLSHGSV